MNMTMRLDLSQRLTVAQRQDIVLSLRLELLHILRGEYGKPHAICPKCDHRLTAAEILRGFGEDPYNFTTTCPRKSCAAQFEAQLHCYTGTNNLSRAEMRFYCPSQTIHRLTEALCSLSPEDFRNKEPSLYFSALTHFGTLKRAFKEARFTYLHQEIRDWKDKVCAFLGRLPDSVIAECVGVSTGQVRLLRRQLEIDPYDRYRNDHE
jgi:hypothetical protein